MSKETLKPMFVILKIQELKDSERINIFGTNDIKKIARLKESDVIARYKGYLEKKSIKNLHPGDVIQIPSLSVHTSDDQYIYLGHDLRRHILIVFNTKYQCPVTIPIDTQVKKTGQHIDMTCKN